jgi:hypothetical protein
LRQSHRQAAVDIVDVETGEFHPRYEEARIDFTLD